jgi:hypothetical protein
MAGKRAPIINVHHLIKFYNENDGDIFKLTSALSSHYGFDFSRQQVKNAYARLNKELAKRNVAQLTFAPSRKNEAYLAAAIEEHLASGLLKPAGEVVPMPTARTIRKPKNQKV